MNNKRSRLIKERNLFTKFMVSLLKLNFIGLTKEYYADIANAGITMLLVSIPEATQLIAQNVKRKFEVNIFLFRVGSTNSQIIC